MLIGARQLDPPIGARYEAWGSGTSGIAEISSLTKIPTQCLPGGACSIVPVIISCRNAVVLHLRSGGSYGGLLDCGIHSAFTAEAVHLHPCVLTNRG